LRILVPAVLVVVWLTVAGIGGPYFGKIDQVSSNDQASYLPTSSDSARVQKLEVKFAGSSAIPAIVLFTSPSALTASDRSFTDGRVAAVRSLSGVAEGSSPAILSQDGRAAQVVVPVTDNSATAGTVGSIRTTIAEDLPAHLSAYVTGPAGQLADLSDAFGGIDGILLFVAILAVFVILIIVYRSPLLPIFVLGTSLFALCAAILVVWWLAKDGVVTLNGQVQGILFILVIGAATDYSLLYVSRYREALRDHARPWDATWAAWKASIQPVAASAGTVAAGVLCLLLSELSSNKALGPVAAIGIGFAFLAAMTMLPSVLLLTRRAAFWPFRPAYGSPHPELDPGGRTLWARIGRGISRRARLIWAVCAIALIAASFGLLQLQASGVSQNDLVEGYSQARAGQTALGEHFPQGSGSPVLVVAPQSALDKTARTLLDDSGISAVTVYAADSPSRSLPVTREGVQSEPATGAGGAAGSPASAAPAPAPTVVGGKVLLQATLTTDPDSEAAEATVRRVRSSLSGEAGVLVGGETAIAVDTNDAGAHDRDLIIPVVLIVILLILMLLLRAILAPVLLILSVVLSFAATMGVSALVFDHVFRFPGADPAVPLYGFIFLVALGVDYNIFLMTRIREESVRFGTRPGVLLGLSRTGGVITSAGIVLAATFAALAVIPVLFLSQIAFIVSFGVLLDTLVVRSLLVPALTYDIGGRVWWPSRLARRQEDPAGRQEHLARRQEDAGQAPGSGDLA
jgi:RND superfamily putative drug exporter